MLLVRSVFERHHRFVGWTALFLTCEINPVSSAISHVEPFVGAFTIMSDIYDTDTQTWNLDGVHLVRQQDFWYVMGMTLL